jgi:hypothetical protein
MRVDRPRRNFESLTITRESMTTQANNRGKDMRNDEDAVLWIDGRSGTTRRRRMRVLL